MELPDTSRMYLLDFLLHAFEVARLCQLMLKDKCSHMLYGISGPAHTLQEAALSAKLLTPCLIRL